MPSARETRCDVLVIGSGGAGCAAAVAARDAGAQVVCATKSALGASNTGRAQGGIQAALGDEDSVEAHEADTFAAGHRAARPELVRQLTHSAPEAIRWLEEIGVGFSRDDGRLRLLRCGGASQPRLLQAGERTGADMIKALRTAVRASGAEVWEATPLVELAPARGEAGGWRATVAPGRNGDRRTVRAAAVVLAAGGGLAGEAARLGIGSTNHPDATPEVIELAVALGARTTELESWQQHPTGSVWPPPLAGYALPETTRGYGATLHGAGGERFVDELAPRDVVSEAIVRTVEEGRGETSPDGRPAVWLDTPAIDRKNGAGFTAERLTYVHGRYLKAGVDITRERVLVYPVLHYRNGGLVIDERASTSLDGVFAAGEIAGGVHGRNRLMGNSLLDTVVHGRRAGRCAGERAGG